MKHRLLFAAACLVLLAPLRAEDEAGKAPPKVVQASASDEIKALAGQTATVEGKVTRIGATEGGGITFINLAPGVNGFVAIVFKSSAAQFPDGFDKYKGQTLRVTGKVVLYKDVTPQIEVKAPDQIEIVPLAGATDVPKDTRF